MSDRNGRVVIDVQNVYYFYNNEVPALKNISFRIEANEVVGIIGQNGAGKTTLLKNLLGLLKPSKGTILINGKDTKTQTVAQLATSIGFVLQNPDRQLFAETVEQEIAFGPKNLKLPPEEIQRRVEEAMEAVGITRFRHEYPLALSKGDRAKVVIASVLAMQPEIIILDEPTTGQDYEGCRQIMEIVERLHAAGKTILIVTHQMSLVAEYASRTIVLCRGEILLDGPTREVFAQTEILEQTFIRPPQITQLAQRLAARGIPVKGTELSVEELAATLVGLREGGYQWPY